MAGEIGLLVAGIATWVGIVVALIGNLAKAKKWGMSRAERELALQKLINNAYRIDECDGKFAEVNEQVEKTSKQVQSLAVTVEGLSRKQAEMEAVVNQHTEDIKDSRFQRYLQTDSMFAVLDVLRGEHADNAAVKKAHDRLDKYMRRKAHRLDRLELEDEENEL